MLKAFFTKVLDCVRPRGWYDWVGLLCFLLCLSVVTTKLYSRLIVPGKPELTKSKALGGEDRGGLADFRDAIYYPIVALEQGNNPYDAKSYIQKYPVGNIFPLYSPLILLIYVPFSWFGFSTGLALYWVLNLILLLIFAAVVCNCTGWQLRLGNIALLAAVIVISQPGRANFHAGQVALPLALALVVALHYAQSWPKGAIWAVVFASFKPTYGLPLGLFLICRGQVRAGLLGLILGGAIGAVGLVAIFSATTGLPGLPAMVLQNQGELHADPDVDPKQTRLRLDASATVVRLANLSGAAENWANILVPLCIMGVTAGVLCWSGKLLGGKPFLSEPSRETALSPANSVSSQLILVASTICIYHIIYDGVVLFLPAMLAVRQITEKWLLKNRKASQEDFAWLPTLAGGLVCFTFVNILWAPTFTAKLAQLGWPIEPESASPPNLIWVLICASNGICLIGAWLLLIVHSLWQPRGLSSAKSVELVSTH